MKAFLIAMDSTDFDHARMRKLLSHAFSDAALRQQESIMTEYFDLLVQRLKEKVDVSDAGEVDLTQWYNFLTFDIIGDMCFGESFEALESGNYHVWMNNLFQGVKYARFLSIASFYEPAMTILKSCIKLVPAVAKASEEHEKFTHLKTAKRLDVNVNRTDFMSHVSIRKNVSRT
jgi:cytochrome P450